MLEICISSILVLNRVWLELRYSLHIGVCWNVWDFLLFKAVAVALNYVYVWVSSKNLICCEDLVASTDWCSGWGEVAWWVAALGRLADEIWDQRQELRKSLFVAYSELMSFDDSIKRRKRADVAVESLDDHLFCFLEHLIFLLELYMGSLIFFFQAIVLLFYFHVQLYFVVWVIGASHEEFKVTLEPFIFSFDRFLLLGKLFERFYNFSHFRFTFFNRQCEIWKFMFLLVVILR